MNIPERTKKSILGLREMINTLKSKYNIKNKTIIEIGSWTGLSAIEFAKELKHVTCVDPWSPTKGINTKYNMRQVEDIFDNRISGLLNITKLKMKSAEAASYYDYVNDSGLEKEPVIFDFCYIDGCHTYEAVKQDLILWKDRVKKAICGHDYCGKFPGVVKAVNEIVGKPDIVFLDSSWIKFKKRGK